MYMEKLVKRDSRSNFGYSIISGINGPGCPFALIHFNDGSIIKVLTNNEVKNQNSMNAGFENNQKDIALRFPIQL